MGHLRRYFTIVGAILAVAVLARVLFDVPSWATLGILLIVWPLGGTLITIDDDMPGGWSNPDGKYIPEWKMLWWWADILLVRGALVMLAVAVEDAVVGRVAWKPLLAAVVMAGVGWPLFDRGIRKDLAHAS